jgi:hypothetical protein
MTSIFIPAVHKLLMHVLTLLLNQIKSGNPIIRTYTRNANCLLKLLLIFPIQL